MPRFRPLASIALAAPLFWCAGGLALWPDIALHVGVALAAFAIAAGLFAIGQMGGGDVKLIAALALWFPPPLFLHMLIIMAVLSEARAACCILCVTIMMV